MIQELLSLALPVGKFIIASALMVVFYKLLYRGKSSFNASRFYLLTIAVVSILLSQFNIVVYTPPAKVIEIEAPRISVPASGKPVTSVPTTQITTAVAPTAPVEEPTMLTKFMEYLTVRNVAFTLYGVVTLVLFILFFIQLFKILWYKKKGKVIAKDAFNLVINPKIPTPFSFYKSIFINESITGSKLEMILKHELWHIKHRHFLDVFLIEVIVRIFWFNPVLWWVRRELRNVDEFQTDRSVLDEGHDLYKYQTIILEEVMENNSYLANSFNSSFTKKRFIMMKNTYQTSLATLRRVLYVPFLIVVFSMLSFTVGKSEVRYVEKQTEKSEVKELSTKKEVKVESPAVTKTPKKLTNDTLELANKVINEYPEKLDIVINKFKNIQKYDNLMIYFVDMQFIIRTLDIQYEAKDDKLKPQINGARGVLSDQLVGVINQLTESKKAITDFKLVESSNQKIDLLRKELGKIRQNSVIKTIISVVSGDETNNLSIISNTITLAKLNPIIPPKENIVVKSKSPFITLTDEQADRILSINSDELDKMIIKLEKLISEYSPQALKEDLLNAVKMENERKAILKEIEPNSFCDEFYATISKEELQECLLAFKTSKSNIEKIRKSDSKSKGLSEINNSFMNQKVQMKILWELSRIKNIGRNQLSNSPSQFYKNVTQNSVNIK